VALLFGCVQRVFFRHVNEATARVPAAEGCE
jgi:glycolate oxidase iron-sulfur subunit